MEIWRERDIWKDNRNKRKGERENGTAEMQRTKKEKALFGS